VKEFWWKIPVLRGLSPMLRGFTESVAVIFFVSAVTGYGINQLFSDPAEVSEPFAQIGATLLVAYTVQTGWVIQSSRKRGADRENWVGMAVGVGCCALIGILIALCLSPHEESLDLLESFGFAWVVTSVLLLGLWTALQPWAMYDLNHSFNTEYHDE
jgi:uncharacterized membrane protein YfcA